ncbi:MAG: bifunctional folylpolyglutamate synthase/dihydrofolate synthase [Patescibacteria group bacterium]
MFSFKQYNQSFNYLISLANLREDSSITGARDPRQYLKRAKLLLKLAGNPERSAKKIIVVTGTSGKGSTCNILQQILTEAGKKVGTYMSPHSTAAIERIKVNDLYISPDEFTAMVEKAKPIIEKCHEQTSLPSYFENFLLIALLYFKQQKCDYQIIEVGCGGRYDAANALSRIDVAAITNIGPDHLHIIGPTLKDVAYEKAGIIHQNICLTTEKKKQFLKIFDNEAKKTKAKMVWVESKQNPNAELASKMAEYLKIKKQFIKAGIAKAKLPCRLEVIQKNPLVILDSAHNPDKLKYLTIKLQNHRTTKLHIVFALSSPKDEKACLKPLLDNFNCQVYATRFLVEQRRATDPLKIVPVIKKFWPKIKCQPYLDPWQAFDEARRNQRKNETLLITGSTFLCGELRKFWVSEEKILKTRKSFNG